MSADGCGMRRAATSDVMSAMREKLLAYLLNDLDEAGRRAVEEAIEHDASLAEEMERLRDCLDSCDCEQEKEQTPQPPSELATRTCCFVERAIAHSRALCAGASKGPALSESHDGPVANKRWSVVDAAVGVCVLLMLGGMLFPALRDGRDLARRVKCQDNMHRLGAALVEYVQWLDHGLPAVQKGQNAGVFVIALRESEILSREELAELVVCPATPLADRVASGCVRICIPTWEEYFSARGAVERCMRQHMAGDMAYNLGYQDESGNVRQIRFLGRHDIPLLSDAPSLSVAGYHSANHGGAGQNFVFQDLSCRYITTCELDSEPDHWHLNNDGRSAAGCNSRDIVLAPSEATPQVETRSESMPPFGITSKMQR